MTQWQPSSREGHPQPRSFFRRYGVGFGFIAVAITASAVADLSSKQAPTTSTAVAPAPPKPAPAQRTVPADLQEAALRVLRSQGYVCNRVYSSFMWLSEPGFTLYCPRWKFLFYENGGRWRIEPRQT